MQVQPLGDDKWRVFLQMQEFVQLLESAKHQRARTAIYLMAISLRVGTAADLLVGQFYREDGFWWLHVEAKDSTERDRETKPREILVPQVVVRELESHLGDDFDSLPDDREVFDFVKRTLQRDVTDAAENAAVATGDEQFEKVSSHDLRRYYASHYLFRLNVDQHVVRQMGGWKKVEHMIEYLLLPRDLIQSRLADAAVLGEDPLTMTRSGPTDEVDANFDTIEQLVHRVDSDEMTDVLQERLLEIGQMVAGVEVVVTDRAAGRSDDSRSSNEDIHQASFQADFPGDDSGVTHPETVAKAAYVSALVTSSWMVTLAPLF
jgi:hypothetical protein